MNFVSLKVLHSKTLLKNCFFSFLNFDIKFYRQVHKRRLNIFIVKRSCKSTLLPRTRCCQHLPNSFFSTVFYLGAAEMANKSSEGLPLKHVLSKLHAFASPALAESWDNVGLLVEPVTPRPIANILLTNDLTEAVMQEALELSTDLIISYHPPIFIPLKSVTTKTWKERLIATCLENRVALYSPHTSWDVVKDGVNDWLARAFDNEKVTPLMPHINLDPNSSLRVDVSVPSTLNRVSILQALHDRTTQADRELVHYNVLPSSENMVSLTCSESFKHLLSDMFPKTSHGSSGDLIGVSKYEGIPVAGHGTGRLCVLKKPISILEAVERVKKHIGIPYVRLALASDKDQDALISTVALCPGSGTSVLKGVKADLWLTGEMFHHDVLDAVHKGTHVILCNHSDSERGFLTSFADTLTKLLDSKVSVKLSLSDCDPLKTV
uniref:NIF3-like protein 1 n=1 Tax=Timema bartmani TaxID=61472 RepID=A0A7R9ESJ1_9NEOP|nr:unnamed protein product [Timema bartmani]